MVARWWAGESQNKCRVGGRLHTNSAMHFRLSVMDSRSFTLFFTG
jgi:hypothetical protein